jgi:hypothetical protein
MTQARYFILKRDGQWKIKYRKELFGPYRSESEALLFAIDAAHSVASTTFNRSGLTARVHTHHARVVLQV